MVKINNPILRGFHPDPCFCKANNKYYIITSTFEWVPGICVYESKDLVNWKLIRNILDALSLDGIPDSAGIWAPALSYDGEYFYLVYTISKQIDGYFKDVENYVITAKDIMGVWSEPKFINASGFDPSMYHEDGRHYVLNPQWDARPLQGHQKFNGLVLQEFDFHKGMIGKAKVIFKGSATGGAEGPHLIKRNGYYYIFLAEGGTGRHHSICVARAKELWGPYEVSPYHPLITSWQKDTSLKKAGHGNYIETTDGKCYLVHLCARYLPGSERSVLGRETAIQEMQWIANWPKLIQEDNAPLTTVEIASAKQKNPVINTYHTRFEKGMNLVLDGWLSLRTPFIDKLKFVDTGIALQGQDSLTSLHHQSLIARRWESFHFMAETTVQFTPYHYSQMAGLTCYYNTKCFYYLYVGYDEKRNQRILNILVNDNFNFSEPLQGKYIYVPQTCANITLRVIVKEHELQFFYAFEDGNYQKISTALDSSILSDEYVSGWAYTGAMVGLSVIDTFNKDTNAIFTSYKQENYECEE